MNKLLVFFLSASNFLYIPMLCKPVVNIDQGLVRGNVLESKNGRSFSEFLGIPYAEPPMGNLRFRSPLPAKKWEGILSAEKEIPSCFQIPRGKGKVIGNEDCLYLNVLTPVLEFNPSVTQNTFNNRLLPVMVWIHGGGFFFGKANAASRFLLNKDIVFVSMNYRLGLFGFLTTGDSVAPGNFGLKDQNFALKWVKKNIEAFGGDPNRITIFGNSAGAVSVSLHVLSNASKGLFNQYIVQSGNALVPWGYRDRSLFKPDVNFIANKVGCPTDTSEMIIHCLRERDAFELMNLTSYHVFDFPDLKWIPTNEVESEDAFLTDSPQNLISRNEMRDYPLMTGIVADEGLYITSTLYLNSSYKYIKETLDKNIELTSKHYLFPGNAIKFRRIIEDFYFKESELLTDKRKLLENYTKFAGDNEFIYPNSMLIEKMTAVSKKPLYSYVFSYRGKECYTANVHGIKENIGVSHSDELLYLFASESKKDQTDEYIMELMIDLWTSFVINGRPISHFLDVPNLWEPYAKQKRFLQIGSVINNTVPSVTLRENYFSDRMNFWKNNFPVLSL